VAREHSIEEVVEDLEKLRYDVQRLADRLDTAPFVRVDVHNEQISKLTEKLKDTKEGLSEQLATVKSYQTWILGIMGSAAVAFVVAVITAIAQGRLG